MSDWRPSLIAAAIVVFAGVVVGVVTQEPERPAKTVTQDRLTPSGDSEKQRSSNTSTGESRSVPSARSTSIGPLKGKRACEEMGLGIRTIEIRRGEPFVGCALELTLFTHEAEVNAQPDWTALRVTFASDRQTEFDRYCDYKPDVGASRQFTVSPGATVIRRFDLSRVRSKFELGCIDGETIAFQPEIVTGATK